jgi:hypothetical protein
LSTGSTRNVNWGFRQTVPVPADYDGDGITDLAVYQLNAGNWYIWPSGGGPGITAKFGGLGVIPVPSDYDGDGKADLATYYRAAGTWSIRLSRTGTTRTFNWGWSAAIPAAPQYYINKHFYPTLP